MSFGSNAVARRRILVVLVAPVIATVLLLSAGCCKSKPVADPAFNKPGARAQLDIGYSLLYEEAKGIPKLKWVFMFKDKDEEVASTVNGLIDYYKKLAESMEQLAKQFPAVRIDVAPMSGIEGDTRKAIGADQAKDFMPIVGKTGPAFERQLLLLFFNALDEQRHLVGVMIEREAEPPLIAFLANTKTQLETRHEKIEALLNRRYFSR